MTYHIGNVNLKNRFILGPMAGVTDRPFRVICHEMGAGLVSMEMVSANALKYGNKKTFDLTHIDPKEHPVSLQIFGPDAETMVTAAEALEGVPYDILDINMGCPMPKIVNNGEGSALMKKPGEAEKIVRALVRFEEQRVHVAAWEESSVRQKNAESRGGHREDDAAWEESPVRQKNAESRGEERADDISRKSGTRPVTVKLRAGFDAAHINAPELARRLEAAGAAAIAVHGRTREQYYTGKADWNVIRAVKEAVRIPVIGNGDVTSPALAKQMIEETGCDFVMIARGARGNPWIFRDCAQYFETGEIPPRPTVDEVYKMMLRHARMQLAEKGDYLGICQMRKHIAWYTTGLPNSAALRAKVNECTSFEELKEVLDTWREKSGREPAADC